MAMRAILKVNRLTSTSWMLDTLKCLNIRERPQVNTIYFIRKMKIGNAPDYLMVISFLQRKCHPVTWCIKKIADQPCYNVIFYLRRTEHKY